MSTTVCICKHISEETIKEAIQKGADTIEKVKVATGAAAGACRGGRCSGKIQELINEANN